MSVFYFDEDFLSRTTEEEDNFDSDCSDSQGNNMPSDNNENTDLSVEILDMKSIINIPKYTSNPSEFDILKVLGCGGYGKVFLVKKNCGINKDNLFAMKVMKKASLIRSFKDVIHTRSERNILESIKHPFIVDLYFAFQTNSKLYLVMEYLSGGELLTHLMLHKRLDEDTATFYLAEVVLVLEHLHKNGIIYRDLKPENILIASTGHIKLTDFGLSKESLFDDDVTHTLCGTVEYMAPEVLTMNGYTKTADWWSLGALMYDMMTGKPPFSQDTRDKTIEHIIRGKLIIPNYLSEKPKDLLKKLLRRNPCIRLGGSIRDATSIKDHAFFANINWSSIVDSEPPFKPRLKNIEDTSLFDRKFTSMTPIDSPCNSLNEISESIFKGFTYVSPLILEHEILKLHCDTLF